MSQNGKGVLRLCTQCNTGYHWLPPLLQSFHRKFPGVDVQIMVNATDRPIEALLEGQIDLAVVTSDVDDKRLATAPLFEDELVAVVPANASVRQARLHRADDFAEEHLIVYKADRSDSYIFTRILGTGRRRAGARVAGAADRSDPRAGQGGARHQRHGALGDRAGDQVGSGQGGPHRPPRRLPRVDRRHAERSRRAQVAAGIRGAALASGAAGEDGALTLARADRGTSRPADWSRPRGADRDHRR